MAKKSKKQSSKVQKVVTVIKARGKPDEIKVERSTETQMEYLREPIRSARYPISRGMLRIIPKMPRLR